MRTLGATNRTVQAVRKADGLPRNEVSGMPGSKAVTSGGSSKDRYRGPFTIVKKNDTTVTVKAYDGSTYLSKNWVIGGLTRVEVNSDTDITITTSGSIYAKITNSGVSPFWVITFGNASDLPAQAYDEYYVELYAVTFSGGVIQKLERSRAGHIEITGRIV